VLKYALLANGKRKPSKSSVAALSPPSVVAMRVAAQLQAPMEAESASAQGEGDVLVNFDEACEHIGGDQGVLRRLLAKFRERAVPSMTALDSHFAEGDWTKLKREAHSLKGSGGYVGAISLKAVCEALCAAADKASACHAAAVDRATLSGLVRRVHCELKTISELIDAKLNGEGAQAASVEIARVALHKSKPLLPLLWLWFWAGCA